MLLAGIFECENTLVCRNILRNVGIDMNQNFAAVAYRILPMVPGVH